MWKKFFAFTTLSYFWTWSALLYALRIYQSDLSASRFDNVVPWILVASFGPLIAGLVTVTVFDGPPKAKDLLRSAIRIRAPFWAYLVAILAPVLVAALAGMTFSASGIVPPIGVSEIGLFLAVSLAGVLPGLIGGPIGEELGWRGVLFPTLLERFTPLTAALVIAPVWASWHGPAFFMSEWRSGVPIATFVPIYLVSVTGLSMLLGAVKLRSPDSLVPAMLGHSAHNTAQGALVALGMSEVIAAEHASRMGWTIAILLLAAGFAALKIGTRACVVSRSPAGSQAVL